MSAELSWFGGGPDMKACDESRAMVYDKRQGRVRPAVDQDPVWESGRLGWRGFRLEQHRVGRGEWLDVCSLHATVVVQLEKRVSVDIKEGESETYTRHTICPGDVSVFSPNVQFSSRSEDCGEFLMVSLDPSFLTLTVPGLMENGHWELKMKIGVRDPLIHALCLALKDEVEQGGNSGTLYSETMATSLAVHLARHYCGQIPRPRDTSGGLPQRHVRQVLEFVREHLHRDVTLREMAAVTGLSPFHFARLFKKSLGVSPYKYVLQQRIERAKQHLIRGEMPLAVVAVETGFFDQSHLTTHFRRHCGVTPRQFATHFRNGRNVTK